MKNANQIRNIIPSFRNFPDRSPWRRGFFLVPFVLAAPSPVCLNRRHKKMANRILRATLSLLVIWGSFLLVPHSLYAQTTFTDVSGQCGISGLQSSWCASWADYDGDGNVDVMALGHNQGLTGSTSHLWHNNGDGTFTDATTQAGMDPHNGDAHGAVWADFDSDGQVDLYVAKGTMKEELVNYNDLWRNNGNGTFANIAHSADVEGLGHRSRGSGAVDYDNDSDLDIFNTNFERPSGGGMNVLYRNNGDLTFTDVATGAGLLRPDITNRTAAWADFNRDGFIDVFITEIDGLYKNNGDGTFTDVTVAAGIINGSDIVESGAWGDYDNDGNPDLYLTEGTGGDESADGSQVPDTEIQGILYHNNGDGTFTDVTTQSGAINMVSALGVTWEDYDNDGYLDLYIVNTEFASKLNRLYRNNRDGTFTDVAAEAGVGAKSAQGGRGSDASFMDYNNDGFPDLFVCNGAGNKLGPLLLFRNNGNSNGWLNVALRGTQSNRGGIGAKLRLKAARQTQYREFTEQHYMGQNYVPIHFGLGQATIIDSLTITWPSGTTQTLRNIAVNQTIKVREPRR
jgi:enediyne biosynthesis protein E4